MKIRITAFAGLLLALVVTGSAAELSTLKAQIESTIPRARGEVGVAINARLPPTIAEGLEIEFAKFPPIVNVKPVMSEADRVPVCVCG